MDIETLMNHSNIKDFVVKEGRGVKGLAELGLKKLPQQYIQPLEKRFTSIEEENEDSIPVNDMSNWDEPKVAKAVCDAARKWGFFQIVNHGVPIHVLEDGKNATHKFFRLPPEEKIKHSRTRLDTNTVHVGSSFSPETEKALEWKDFLSFFFVSSNVDEAASIWPPVCRNATLEYITKESFLMGSKRISLNYYPICPNPELTVGVGCHSDVSTLSVLLQDDIGGLYVRNTETMKWIHVTPISGSLVINIGDALQIISNGNYKNVEHRVSANGNSNRISVTIFVNPGPSDVIGPLPEVHESGEKPHYKHILYSDYVKHFFGKAHDGKATIEFAKV